MVKNLKSLVRFLPLVALLISKDGFADQYYGSFSLGETFLTNKTYDWNEDSYPYKFSPNVMSFKAEVGKHINEKFDLGLEVMTTSKFNHKYSGPIESGHDGIPNKNFSPSSQDPMVYTSQNIKSTTFLLQGKYKYRPYFFSEDARIYTRTGLGLALNTSSDYMRNIMQSFLVVYPGSTKANLGFSLGFGFEKKLGRTIIGIGYDCYSVGSFETKNQAYITNLSNGIKAVEIGQSNEVIGKRLRPINTLLHSVTMSIGFEL